MKVDVLLANELLRLEYHPRKLESYSTTCNARAEYISVRIDSHYQKKEAPD
jgi:hypothetical protein